MKCFTFHLASVFCKITLLSITFVIGVASTILLPEILPPTVTLCQIAQNPEWYHGKNVRVEADGRSVIGALFIADETCSSHEAAAGVWLAEGYKPSGETHRLYLESEDEVLKARVIIIGRFDAYATRGCYVPKAAIRATSVKLKSEITTEPLTKRTE